MATYTVQAPDGHQITLQGPDGASHDEIVAQAQKLYQPKPAPDTKPASPITGLHDLGGVGNSLLAADLQFTHNIPFVGDAVMTGARYLGDMARGEHPTWDSAKGELQAVLNSGQAQHPVASGVGGVAGAIDTAVLGGAALKAAGGGEAVFSALPKAVTTAGKLANAGRLAAAGATAGAAQGAAQGASNALTAGQNVAAGAEKGAAEGAVGGAVVGPLAAGAVTAVRAATRPLAAKTASALAKMFGENAADLQAAWSTFKTTTGRAPTMAEMASLKQRGEIAGAAKNSQPIAAALTQAADDAAAARSANMQQTFTPGAQASREAANATTAQGDIDYPAARKFDFSIPTAESADLGGVSPADHIAGPVLDQAGLKTADKVRIRNDLAAGKLSGQDAQLIRSGIGTTLNRAYSPAVAGHLDDLESFLAAPGNEAANEALQTATANFRAGSQRAEGVAHGEAVLGPGSAANYAAESAAKPNANENFTGGVEPGQRSALATASATPSGAERLAGKLASDDNLHAKLVSGMGQDTADAFRRIGQAESGAAENMNALARRTPPAEAQDGKDVSTALRGLATVASHGVYKFYHGAKALSGLGMPPAVQEKVAQYLSDPKMTQQGINLLRKAGASNAQLRQLAVQAAANSGAVAGQVSTDVAGP